MDVAYCPLCSLLMHVGCQAAQHQKHIPYFFMGVVPADVPPLPYLVIESIYIFLSPEQRLACIIADTVVDNPQQLRLECLRVRVYLFPVLFQGHPWG